MVPKCQSLTMWQFVRQLGPAAMRQTLQLVGVKWMLIGFTALVCLIGGKAWKDPAWLNDLGEHPGAMIAASMIMFAIFLLIGAHKLHCEQSATLNSTLEQVLSELEQLRAITTKKTPATPVFVRRIIDNLAYHGQNIRDNGNSELRKLWTDAAVRFMRAAIVPSWSDWFIGMSQPRGDIRMIRNDGQNEDDHSVLVFADRVDWCETWGSKIGDAEITYNCNEDDLLPWVNWRPPVPIINVGGTNRGSPTTPVFVRRIMEHLAYAGAGLDGIAAATWRNDALEFVQAALTPSKRIDFELPGLSQRQYTYWLQSIAVNITESDIQHGATDEKLVQWLNWKPPQS